MQQVQEILLVWPCVEMAAALRHIIGAYGSLTHLNSVFQGLFFTVSCFLGLMIWERGLTPVCLVVSTLLPWRSHTFNFCLFVYSAPVCPPTVEAAKN
jgi:hypothetical protein